MLSSLWWIVLHSETLSKFKKASYTNGISQFEFMFHNSKLSFTTRSYVSQLEFQNMELFHYRSWSKFSYCSGNQAQSYWQRQEDICECPQLRLEQSDSSENQKFFGVEQKYHHEAINSNTYLAAVLHLFLPYRQFFTPCSFFFLYLYHVLKI